MQGTNLTRTAPFEHPEKVIEAPDLPDAHTVPSTLSSPPPLPPRGDNLPHELGEGMRAQEELCALRQAL